MFPVPLPIRGTSKGLVQTLSILSNTSILPFPDVVTVSKWATPEHAQRGGGVIHLLTGCAGENRTRRPVAQRLMRPLFVVETEPSANAPARLDHRAIRLDEGEWRGALQPRALSEPDVNLSIHPAPIIQPLVPGSVDGAWDYNEVEPPTKATQ